ncbi:valine--tRNA ligase, mitochondrial-like [Lathamus discolor]|uniref:valine--tRNA ligase, mitochondrial-like n=1 Tax=Lathamus discolor TaxID=678569 RepID=UPI0032B7AAAE
MAAGSGTRSRGQLLPIVTDPSVEPSRGTGAVKVTPGHSPRDLVLARAQGLPLLSVIGDDGTMSPPGGGGSRASIASRHGTRLWPLWLSWGCTAAPRTTP